MSSLSPGSMRAGARLLRVASMEKRTLRLGYQTVVAYFFAQTFSCHLLADLVSTFDAC